MNKKKNQEIEIEAILYSDTAPDREQTKRFEAFLAEKYGQVVSLTWQKSDEFPGGFRLEVGSEIYDWSVNGRFQQLRNILVNVPSENGNIIPLIKETINNWTPKHLPHFVLVFSQLHWSYIF